LINGTLSVAYPIGDARQSGRSWVANSQFDCYVKTLHRGSSFGMMLGYCTPSFNDQAVQLKGCF
jgi:hypothetical protein